jgi:riboflavin kinase/FMN adenylyltransferase
VTDEARPLRIAELSSIGPAVVTLGVFDGVHLGHRALLAATRNLAAELSSSGLALVFDPPPEEVLRPGTSVPRLAPLRVNLARIEAAGLDRVMPIRFDDALRELAAGEFLDALSPAVEVAGLVMSSRSAFGRDRGGTPTRMEELGAERGFAVRVVEPIEVGDAIVSSTRIREAIASGDVEGAQALGVVPYLEGIVVTGDRRGRELGFPTANLRLDYTPAMPALGIYAGRLTEGGPSVTAGHPALISIGTRPTFHDGSEVLAEVHLLDFDGDLYGALLGVELVARLREERRFEDVDALVAQMERDAEMGRVVLGMSGPGAA